MRSRTEMVTTTFVDSEEELSEDDDSEEDWRPSASSKNGKKQKQTRGAGSSGGGGGGSSSSSKRGRKRKGSASNAKATAKRKQPSYEESDEEDDDEPSDDEFDEFEDFDVAPTGSAAARKPTAQLPPKKLFAEKNSNAAGATEELTELLLYKGDLVGDYANNKMLCLWRREDETMLQKYIRVSTALDEFLFTSSSVYSQYDDERTSDFLTVKIKAMDPRNRRVKILDIDLLERISMQETEAAAKRKTDGKSADKPVQNDDEHVAVEEVEEDENDEEEDVNNTDNSDLEEDAAGEAEEPEEDGDEDEDDDEDDDDDGEEPAVSNKKLEKLGTAKETDSKSGKNNQGGAAVSGKKLIKTKHENADENDNDEEIEEENEDVEEEDDEDSFEEEDEEEDEDGDDEGEDD